MAQKFHSDLKFLGSNNIEISGGIIDNLTGDLVIQNSVDDSDIIFKSDDINLGSGTPTEYFRLDGSTRKVEYSVPLHSTSSAHFEAESGVGIYGGGYGTFSISNNDDSYHTVFGYDGGAFSYIDGQIVLLDYGSGNETTGTAAYNLAVTSDGTLIEVSTVDDADTAKRIEVDVKNVFGATMTKGTVVHVQPTGTLSGNVIEVVKADANVAANMPAIAVLNEDLANNAEGKAVMFGTVQGIDTSSFSVGDELYVSTTAGEFTATKPTATTELVQKIAVVIKSHASNGLIKVFGAGRSNDVPNRIERDVNFTDNSVLSFGTGSDLRLQHSSGNNSSYIQNYTGDLRIENLEDDKDIIFRNDNGSGGLATYMSLDGSATRVNFFVDTRHSDNVKALFGGGGDLQIYHDGSNSYIENETGNLTIFNKQDDGDVIFASDNGSGGTTTYYYLDGSEQLNRFQKNILLPDGVNISLGSSFDLQLYHDGGTESFISNITGNLIIQNTADDSDIIFKSDDGSGGVTQYFRIDGGANLNVFSKDIFLADNIKALFGSNSDLQIYHDGTHSFVKNTTGNLYLLDDGYVEIGNGVELYAGFVKDGAVNLYYDNSKKFETTNTGVKTTGEIVVDGTTGAFANSGITLKRTGVLTGDADILLAGTSGSEALSFRINDSEKVRIENSGNATFAGSIKLEGPDGGLVFRNWTANSGYASIATNSMTGGEYALLTDGTNTFLSGGNGGYVSIRGGDNNTAHQLIITATEAKFYGTVLPNSNATQNFGSSSNRWNIGYFSSLRITNVVTNKILKFDGTDIDDSLLSDDGTTVSSGANFIPTTDSTYDLGTTTNYWRNIYADNIISEGGDAEFQKVYKDTVTINDSTYTTVATVTGNSLASGVRLNVSGVGSSSVINVDAKILVNHYRDILIKSTCTYYKKLYIKVVSDNNEDFAIELKKDTGGASSQSVNIEIIPLNSEEITITNSHSISGTTHEHLTEYGESQSSNDADGGHDYHYWLKDDGAKLKLGGSQDLQIYHDGANSYIQDAGAGELRINTDNAIRFRKHDNETMALFTANGSAELWYDNAKKFETYDSGTSTTGNHAISSGSKLMLRGTSDNNHYVRYSSSGFSGVTIDGPQVVGHQGGELATNIGSDNYSLRWNSGGDVFVRTDLTVYGGFFLDGISGGHFENYQFGVQLDISEITSGGWARSYKINTSDSTGSLNMGVLGNNTTTTYGYFSIGGTDVTGYNSANSIKLTKGGKVGIKIAGGSSPDTTLHINGNATDGWIKLSTTSGNPYITSTNNLEFYVGNSNSILYLENGTTTVGINKNSGLTDGGFGSPKLVIKQDANSDWGGINIEASGNDAVFGISTTDSAHMLAGSYRSSAGYKPIQFKTSNVVALTINTDQTAVFSNDIYTDHIIPNTSNAYTIGTTDVYYNNVIARAFSTTAAGDRTKIRVWSGSTYGIGMKNGYNYGHITNGEYAMSFQMNSDNNRGFWWGDSSHSDSQGAMSLTTHGRLTVATSISVGEGESITSPSSVPLYVNGAGTANAATLKINNQSSSAYNHSIEAFAPNMTATETNVILVGVAGSTKNSAYIGYKFQASGSNDNLLTFGHWASDHLFNIKGDGKIGIGTQDPNGLVEIYGNGNSWSAGPAIRFWDSTNTKGWLVGNINNQTAGDFYIRTLPSISGNPGSSNVEFTIKHSTGYIGVGTLSPVVKLNVVGSAYFSGNDAWNGGGSEGNKTDIALVIDEGDTIYTRDSGQYLRTLIKKDTGDNIQIGQSGTSLIDNINFFSGSSCSYTWYNNSSAAMKLTSTGLGIGTSSPVKPLHISASNPIIRLSDSDAGTTSAINSWIEWYRGNNTERAGYIGYPSTSNSDFYVKNEISNGDVVLLAGNTERMRITNAGEILLNSNTAISNRKLRSEGGYSLEGGGYNTSYTSDGLYGGSATPNILSASTGQQLRLGYLDNGSGLYSTAYVFETRSTDGLNNTVEKEALIVKNTNSGNWVSHITNLGTGYFTKLGVGVTSPGERIHVKQNTNAHLVSKLEQDNASYQAWFEANSQDNSFARFGIGDNGDDFAFINTNESDFKIFMNSQEKFRINTNGDFVFNTLTAVGSSQMTLYTTQTYGITVQQNKSNGSSDFCDTMFLQNVNQNNSNSCKIGMSTNGTDGQHHRVTLAAERDTSANYRGEFSVHIRQSDASHPKRLKLDYNGNLTVSGDVIAYGSPSDKRLKENIKPINNALDTVQKLQGVTFDWKESKSLLDIKNDIGFIAQDVKEVLPELVRENEDGQMSLRDKGIVPVLVEAIKELKAEIEQLKSELKK